MHSLTLNKNGAESNIFHVTPLNYISPIDRGGKIDEIINNTFKINISDIESKFEYIKNIFEYIERPLIQLQRLEI